VHVLGSETINRQQPILWRWQKLLLLYFFINSDFYHQLYNRQVFCFDMLKEKKRQNEIQKHEWYKSWNTQNPFI